MLLYGITGRSVPAFAAYMETASTKQAFYKMLKSKGADVFGKGVQKATVGGLATLDK